MPVGPTLKKGAPWVRTISICSVKICQSTNQMPSLQSSPKKKHICSTCQHPFKTSSHLARHSRVHTGERYRKCPFPGCKTQCSRQDDLPVSLSSTLLIVSCSVIDLLHILRHLLVTPLRTLLTPAILHCINLRLRLQFHLIQPTSTYLLCLLRWHPPLLSFSPRDSRWPVSAAQQQPSSLSILPLSKRLHSERSHCTTIIFLTLVPIQNER